MTWGRVSGGAAGSENRSRLATGKPAPEITATGSAAGLVAMPGARTQRSGLRLAQLVSMTPPYMPVEHV